MDNVTIVNHMAAPVAALRRPAALQSEDVGGAEEIVEAVVVEMHVQAMADEARRHGVEHAPQDEAAARGDDDALFLIIGGAAWRQRFERGALNVDALAVAGIAPSDHFVDEAAIGGKVGEVPRVAQQKFVLDHFLKMTVCAFDGAILVGDT
jgi:hypothetical protein